MEIRVKREDDDLRIRYDGFEPDLDTALIKVLKSVGWEWWASGFNHLSEERDLAFDYAPSNKS